MSLKDKFLVYVEYQRAAEHALRTQGPTASIDSFEKANKLKRDILMMMDELEGSIDLDPDNRVWYYDGDGTKRLKDE